MRDGVSLAHRVVVFDPQDNGTVLPDCQGGRIFDDPVSFVGGLCGVLKSFHLSVKVEKSH